MKNLWLIILFAIFTKAALAQGDLNGLKNHHFTIIDTVRNIEKGQYYLSNISRDRPVNEIIVRKLNDDLAIIRAVEDKNHSNRKYFQVDNSWKLSGRLVNSWRSSKSQGLFSVRYAKSVDPDFLKRYGEVKQVSTFENAHVAVVEASLTFVLKQLIADQNVEYVDLVRQEAMEESPIRQYNMNLNRINYAQHSYSNVVGKGLNISVKEHSIFNGDIDLLERVILNEYSSSEFTQHAKEMGTLIAGNGNSFKTGQGVVPNAQLVCTDFNMLFAEGASYYNSNNITVQNHAYGTGIENFYGNESISYDQITVDIPELIHVFSAGNMGDQAAENGMYANIKGYANLTGTFKQAKNVLVIGALDSAGNYVSSSSSGPAYDGRIKPDLCAFGGEGSSESAALVSGSVAMVQNRYQILHGSYPASSLIKCLLIAGANDVHSPGIDFKTGYGSLDLHRSLQVLDSSWFQEDTISTDEINSFLITVPDYVDELKVVISWIDPPANPEDATGLVSDLDLSVASPSNEIFLPWILNSTPDVSMLSALPIRGEDHLNNAELISVENPVSGNYKVHVKSNQLQGQSQRYSIAYCLSYKDVFEWTFPTASDHLQAASNIYFRWNSSYEASNAQLSIRYGLGAWKELGKVDLANGLQKYTLKDTASSAQLKMTFSGEEFLSDVFTISALPKIIVENDCDEDFILSWDPVENSTGYLLSELVESQLSEVLSTTDTFLTLNKDKYPGSYFAIQPILSDTMKALRSFATNYKNSNKGCYLNNFLVFLGLDEQANIQLSVNVPEEIEEISIQKEQQGIKEVFTQFSPGKESYFEFEDPDLMPGRVEYSTRILLEKGGTIFSDTLSFYYTNENAVIVFPNPTYDDFVAVLNDFPGAYLELVDERGAFIGKYDLVTSVEDIELTRLRNGTYIYRIFFNDQLVNTGKIIKM